MAASPSPARRPSFRSEPRSRRPDVLRRLVLPLVVAALGAAALPIAASAQAWEPQIPEGTGTHPTGSVLIQGLDTIWTATGEKLAGADIHIVDGVIRAIGPGLDADGEVRIIDGRGMHAIPGIVDEHSHIAMAATNEFTAPIVAEVRVMDALRPDDFGIYRALSGGVTTARIMHGSSNPIGGQSAVIKTRWGMESSHDLLLPGAPRFVKFALGENVTRKGGGFGADARYPRSRQGVEALYRQVFTAARAYGDTWDRYEADPGSFRVPPRRDLRMEAVLDIMEGRIRIHAHSYRADEILMLMRIAEEFGFRIDVFTHVLEGYKVATEMAEHGAAGSTFSDWWQYKLEAYDAIPYNAAIMHEKGVLTGINSDIPWLQSFMITEIVKPVKYGGVSRDDALRMLTLYPARMMYIDDKVGSLEEGKQGDVVLLSGSPFDAFTRVEKTIVDGIVYYDLEAEEETRGEPILTVEDRVAPAAPMTGASGAAPRGEVDGGDPRVASASPSAGVGAGVEAGLGAEAGGAAGPAAAQESVVALVGGTVHPVSSPAIDDGVVVVRGGVIEAVGPAAEVEVPADARRLDVSGRHVYPGMIDPVSPLGLFEFGQVGQATDLLEVGDYNPHVRAIAAVMPEFPQMKVARMNGMTAAGVAQSTGVIQGTMGVVALSDGDTWERVAIREEGPLIVDFPVRREPRDSRSFETFAHTHGELEAMGAGSYLAPEPAVQESGDGPEPSLDGEEMEALIEVLERARTYAEAPSVTDDPTRRFEANVWGGDRVFLDAMMPAMEGRVPVFFRMETDWQIRHLFLLMDRFPELRPVVVGGTQAYRVADELASRDVPVVLTLGAAYRPTPDRDESITASYRNAARLAAAGVTVGFASDDSEHARNVPYMAAWSVAFGLPEEEALRAVTANNAEILGLGDVMGTLEPGKRADLLVTDGSPLQFLTTIDRMFVGGVEVDPRDNAHTRLYERYRTRR